jgi:DNA-directed RNA polymerase subunit omega
MTDTPRTFGGNSSLMRNDYLQSALKVIDDPTILVNVVSRRVKQLKRGNRPLVESLEKLSHEDTALREIAEGKITYQLATEAELAKGNGPARSSLHKAIFSAT